MEKSDWVTKNNFLYPRSHYHGKFTPENLTFNANLQEFALRISLIAGLHTGGKLSSTEAYYQVKELWHQLKQSKKFMKFSNLEGTDGE